MENHAPADIDPANLQSAQKNWCAFTKMVKINLAVVILLLVAMAVFLV